MLLLVQWFEDFGLRSLSWPVLHGPKMATTMPAIMSVFQEEKENIMAYVPCNQVPLKSFPRYPTLYLSDFSSIMEAGGESF